MRTTCCFLRVRSREGYLQMKSLPPDESSQPPSYPGSPHSSDGLWEDGDVATSDLRRLPVTTVTPAAESAPNEDGDTSSSISGTSMGEDEENPVAPGDTCVLHTLVSPWPGVFELYAAQIDCNGLSYVVHEPITPFEYPNTTFAAEHRNLVTNAAIARSHLLGRPASSVNHVMTWEVPIPLEPMDDLLGPFSELTTDEDSNFLGDVQILAQTIEHKAGVRPPATSDAPEPETVGLMDQPT
ncbi:hypothetical protein DFH09DRAFT_1085060 [Mycena vulgaris]|nr:hypothetical protein DFH09DRAFT_1085060 [Mycena vulgaris]